MAGGPWRDLRRPPLDGRALRRALLAPHGAYARLDVTARTGSTNADLAARAGDAAGWPDRSVLVTDHQDAGRGRLGRSWQAPPGAAVAVSVLLRPSAPPQTWAWLGLLAGLAAARALQRVAGVPARLKWPNDVLLDADAPGGELLPAAGTGKVCGVLAEAVPQAGAVVVGAGVNVDQEIGELPARDTEDGALPATSLRLAGSATTDCDTVMRAYLRELAVLYEEFEAFDGDVEGAGLAAGVREMCVTLGRDVRVERPGGRGALAGRAREIDSRGQLVVDDGSGAVHAVAAGDVVHARRC